MKISFKEFKEFKQNYKTLDYYNITSKSALRALRFKKDFEAWKDKYNFSKNNYPDSDGVLHDYELKNGYVLRFKLLYETDYLNEFEHEYKTFFRFDCKPEYAENGSDFSRYSNDHLYYFCDLSNDRQYIPAEITIDKDFIRQFYDNRNFSKGEAYRRMLLSAKQAVESDVKYNFKDEKYCCMIEIVNPTGEVIDNVNIGFCDSEYSHSGLAFYEHDLIGEALEIIKNDIGYYKPLQLVENYQCGACI